MPWIDEVRIVDIRLGVESGIVFLLGQRWRAEG